MRAFLGRMAHDPSLFPPGCSREQFPNLKDDVGGKSNQNSRAMLSHAPTLPTSLMLFDVHVFVCFLLAGLYPPMSLFLHTMLGEYRLALAQLHPNALLLLAIFQH